MSLTDWVQWDKELIDALFDKPAFKHAQYQLTCLPLSTNYGTVGAAFDYLMRIKLYLHNYKFVPLQYDNWGMTFTSNGQINAFPLTARHGAKTIKGKQFIHDFIDKLFDCVDNKYDIHSFATDCIILAKLESIYRSGKIYPDSIIFNINDNDVKDLDNLIGLTNINEFTSTKQCIMNPTFGNSSKDIGGADADIIIDDTIIDIKTTKYSKFEKEYFRQLVGYYILNAREGNKYGKINNLGIYFSRYGLLFKFPIPPMKNISNVSWLESKPKKKWDSWKLIEESINDYQGECL